jgi:hypothetical protein
MNSSACFADNRRRKNARYFCRCAGILVVTVVGVCSNPLALTGAESAQDYQPDNIYARPPWLSLTLKRVAVLPLAAAIADHDLPNGCEALAPLLGEELVKIKRFEVVSVSAETLRRRTGRSQWTGTESLPPDFFTFLQGEYGCDGVLFCELTTYQAYAPLAVGWRLKLVDIRTGQILWSVDELFDASRPAVARAAQKFGESPSRWPFPRQENWVALNSPRQFGRYAVASVLKTVPQRQ